MSVQTWMDEFYTMPSKQPSVVEGLRLTLRKYQGMTSEARTRHGVKFDEECTILLLVGIDEADRDVFALDSATCIQCQYWTCGECPLNDNELQCSDLAHTWSTWVIHPSDETLSNLLKFIERRIAEETATK
jgi:hypothetical protein